MTISGIIALHVIKHVAVLPFDVLAVTIAEPGLTPVILPLLSTQTTLVLFDDQIIDLSVALLGLILAVSLYLSPTLIVYYWCPLNHSVCSKK